MDIVLIVRRCNMSSKPAIFIPCHNKWPITKICLDSLLAQTYQDFDVYVCDNYSSDETVTELPKMAEKHDNIIALRNDDSTNYAAAKGNNICLKAIPEDAPIIFRMDNDVWLPTMFMMRIIQFYTDVKHHIDIVSAKHLGFHALGRWWLASNLMKAIKSRHTGDKGLSYREYMLVLDSMSIQIEDMEGHNWSLEEYCDVIYNRAGGYDCYKPDISHRFDMCPAFSGWSRAVREAVPFFDERYHRTELEDTDFVFQVDSHKRFSTAVHEGITFWHWGSFTRDDTNREWDQATGKRSKIEMGKLFASKWGKVPG